MQGYQVLIDVAGLPSSVCLNDAGIAKAFYKVAESIGADVIGAVRYRFVPPAEKGVTVVLTLDASHLSAHSYADIGVMAIDAFISGEASRAERCSEMIIQTLKIDKYCINKQIIARFLDVK